MFCSLLAIPDYSTILYWLTTSSRVCYPANRLAPDSHSCRLSSFSASSHYANEDAPDQGENLCISAKSDRTRAQGGKSRSEKKMEEKKRERERERRELFARARLFIFKPISNYRGYEREFTAAPTKKRNRREFFVRDRDSSLDISHVLSQFAVPRLFIPFSRLSRPVARLLRSITRFSLPLPRSYLPIHVETTSPTNILRKNVHEDARTVVTCEASRPTSTPEGLSCCLIAFRMVTLSIWQCQIQQACISFILFFFKGATIGHLKFLLCFILLFSTTKLYNSNVL